MASPALVTLTNTASHTINSSCVSQQFSIDIGLPPGYATSNRKFPVLFVLDGNLEFPLAKSVCELLWLGGEIAEAILVGIGYPVHDPGEMLPLRTRDLTPTVTGPGTGGAENFLRFIQRELIPFVDANYRTDANRRALFGDSRGGLFALYALFTAPDTFQRYLIASPSMWWDDQVVFKFERRFADKHLDLPAHIFMSAGSLENDRMLENVIKMSLLLRERHYPNLTLDVTVLEGETHYSVIPAAVSRGLRSILGTKGE